MSADESGPRIIGLTGGLASGKSTVGRMLRALGAQIVDADEVARQVVEPGRPALQQIIAAFGNNVLGPDSRLDRARLAELVFTDESARERLNAITHPEIAAESARRIQAAIGAGAPFVVYEATLIVENGLDKGLDSLIVIDLPPEDQLRRAVARGLTESQARLRMMAQADRDRRLAAATLVVDNSGSETDLQRKVEALFLDLKANRRPRGAP